MVLAAATIVGTVLLSAEILVSPTSSYLGFLNIDDSFYYLTIARNLAEGRFSTFDGVVATNGYHPLWALVLTPVFWITSDPLAALRIAKALELGLLLAASLLVIAVGRQARWPPAAILLAPVCVFSSRVLFQGMETAVQMLLFAALLHAFAALFTCPRRLGALASVAVICGLLPWARLECVAVSLLALTIASARVLLESSRNLRRVLVCWAAVLASVGAYLLYNQLVFHIPVPVSGAVKAYWSQRRFTAEGGRHLLADAGEYLHAHALNLVTAASMLVAVAGSWLVADYRVAGRAVDHAVDAFVLVLVAGYLARLGAAIAFIHPVYDNAYYYVSAVMLQAMAAPVLLSRAWLLSNLTPGAPRMKRSTVDVVATTLLLVVVWKASPWAPPLRWRDAPHEIGWQEASYEGAQWMNGHLPQGAVVGGVDAGVLGFFSKFRVVNLDGLVNSADYLHAMKTQSVEDWARHAGVGFLANAVRVDVTDGCAFIAAGAVQDRPFTGCRLVHRGLSFRQTWSGRSEPMQFRVYALAGRP